MYGHKWMPRGVESERHKALDHRLYCMLADSRQSAYIQNTVTRMSQFQHWDRKCKTWHVQDKRIKHCSSTLHRCRHFLFPNASHDIQTTTTINTILWRCYPTSLGMRIHDFIDCHDEHLTYVYFHTTIKYLFFNAYITNNQSNFWFSPSLPMCLDEADESVGGWVVRGDRLGARQLRLDHLGQLLTQLHTENKIRKFNWSSCTLNYVSEFCCKK